MVSGLVASFFSASLLVSVADTIPVFNVRPSCEAAGRSMNLSPASIETCVNDESNARIELERNWTSYPRARRDECLAETQVGGSPSYVDVLECIRIGG